METWRILIAGFIITESPGLSAATTEVHFYACDITLITCPLRNSRHEPPLMQNFLYLSFSKASYERRSRQICLCSMTWEQILQWESAASTLRAWQDKYMVDDTLNRRGFRSVLCKEWADAIEGGTRWALFQNLASGLPRQHFKVPKVMWATTYCWFDQIARYHNTYCSQIRQSQNALWKKSLKKKNPRFWMASRVTIIV